ncbi:MAG: ribosome small subunit-dependent GTPase A [Actinobacteria bacterium]|nr:ribosome small subunit-dependent GTPase A [Actinomycetota bacterium]
MARRRPDESDIRVRPVKSTRRRSKDRPSHSDSIPAQVITVDRGRTLCRISDGKLVSAMKARELGKNSVVAGDLVNIVGDVSGDAGSLARIVAVQPRRNSLSRTIDDAGAFEKTIAANLDLMIIVSASADPAPRQGFVDRCLAVAFDQGIRPIIVMSKSDLADPDQFLSAYKDLEVKYLRLQRGDDLSELHKILEAKVSVLIGHSGVGKSTLVNALLGKERRDTGSVNAATGRGRHTSSSAISFELPNGGWIIDTPGVRSFGLEHIDRSRVIASFTEFGSVVATCPRNCSHDEASCALNEYVKASPRASARLASLQRLLASSRQEII